MLEVTILTNIFTAGKYFCLKRKTNKKKIYRLVGFVFVFLLIQVEKMGIYCTAHVADSEKSAVRTGKPLCFLHTMQERSLSYWNDLMISGAKCSSPSCGFKLNLILSFHSVGSGVILHCTAQARNGFLTRRQPQISNGYKRSCNCTSSFFPQQVLLQMSIIENSSEL